MNDEILSLIWGATTSIALSVGKALKLPPALVPVLNVVFAGGGYMGYLIFREGKTIEQAWPLALAAVGSGVLMYKGVSQPIYKEIKTKKEGESNV